MHDWRLFLHFEEGGGGGGGGKWRGGRGSGDSFILLKCARSKLLINFDTRTLRESQS